VCTYIRAYVYVSLCVCVCACVFVCICVLVRVCVHVCVCMCVYVRVCVCVRRVYLCVVCKFSPAHARAVERRKSACQSSCMVSQSPRAGIILHKTHICTSTHTHESTHSHTRTHTHTYTRMNMCKRTSQRYARWYKRACILARGEVLPSSAL